MKETKGKSLKILLIILVAILVIFMIFIIRKVVIFNNLEKTAQTFENSSNYYASVIQPQGDSIIVIESYNMDDKHLINMDSYKLNSNSHIKLEYYKDKNEEIGIARNGEEAYEIEEALYQEKVEVQSLNFYAHDFWSNLGLAFKSTVKSDKCNGEKCYLIENANLKLWVSKDTGLVMRKIEGSIVNEYNYEFNNVTDEDVRKPELLK